MGRSLGRARHRGRGGRGRSRGRGGSYTPHVARCVRVQSVATVSHRFPKVPRSTLFHLKKLKGLSPKERKQIIRRAVRQAVQNLVRKDPIEQLWSHFEELRSKRFPPAKTVAELKRQSLLVWASIDQATIDAYVKSFPKKVAACKAAGGHQPH